MAIGISRPYQRALSDFCKTIKVPKPKFRVTKTNRQGRIVFDFSEEFAKTHKYSLTEVSSHENDYLFEEISSENKNSARIDSRSDNEIMEGAAYIFLKTLEELKNRTISCTNDSVTESCTSFDALFANCINESNISRDFMNASPSTPIKRKNDPVYDFNANIANMSLLDEENGSNIKNPSTQDTFTCSSFKSNQNYINPEKLLKDTDFYKKESSLTTNSIVQINDSPNGICWLNTYSQKCGFPIPVYSEIPASQLFSCRCRFLHFTTTGNGSTKKSAKLDSANNMRELIKRNSALFASKSEYKSENIKTEFMDQKSDYELTPNSSTSIQTTRIKQEAIPKNENIHELYAKNEEISNISNKMNNIKVSQPVSNSSYVNAVQEWFQKRALSPSVCCKFLTKSLSSQPPQFETSVSYKLNIHGEAKLISGKVCTNKKDSKSSCAMLLFNELKNVR